MMFLAEGLHPAGRLAAEQEGHRRYQRQQGETQDGSNHGRAGCDQWSVRTLPAGPAPSQAWTGHQGAIRSADIRVGTRQLNGIGPARKVALLRRFGSLEEIRQASTAELMKVPGITEKLAEDILRHLHRDRAGAPVD